MNFALNSTYSANEYQKFEVNYNACAWINYLDGLVQDCSNSIANAMELLQSYAKPLNALFPLLPSTYQCVECHCAYSRVRILHIVLHNVFQWQGCCCGC